MLLGACAEYPVEGCDELSEVNFAVLVGVHDREEAVAKDAGKISILE